MKSKITDWHPAVHDLITSDLKCVGCQKTIYQTFEYANYICDVLSYKWKPLWIYPCRYGLGYHLTSKEPGDKRFDPRTGMRETHKKRATRLRKQLRQRLRQKQELLNAKGNTSQEVVTSG